MKETLKSILNEILNVYNSNLENDEKHKILSELWTSYYKLSDKYNIKLDEAYNLYLLGENESYTYKEEESRKNIDLDKLRVSLDKLKESLNNENAYISENDAKCILDFVVEFTRKSFEQLGISVSNSSLNGFCELGQALSIMPLENLGVEVTKTTASNCFDYPYNHAFGTATFKIMKDGKLKKVSYLIDVTYKQFFTTNRCNEGRYYTNLENTSSPTAPDPGYFIEDYSVIADLLKNGYIEITPMVAHVYGDSFYKAGLTLDKKDMTSSIDYYNTLLNNDGPYSANPIDLDGFDLNILENFYNSRKINM